MTLMDEYQIATGDSTPSVDQHSLMDVEGRAENKPDDFYQAPAPLSDTVLSRTSVNDRQSRIQSVEVTDSVGKIPVVSDKSVGHDIDLPARGDRHTLSTYEAGKIFEEAQCRVSERTIIRWCNKNKQGVRRLDCAFDTGERKYFIGEDSVKAIIREERQKGRQSDHYDADLSDVQDASETNGGHIDDLDGQRPTASEAGVRQKPKLSDDGGHPESSAEAKESEEGRALDSLTKENMELKIQLARLEEQQKTKDELMNILRKEMDRRGETIKEDRETYQNSLKWHQAEFERKERLIESLRTEVRGLLEAPKRFISSDEVAAQEEKTVVKPAFSSSPDSQGNDLSEYDVNQ